MQNKHTSSLKTSVSLILTKSGFYPFLVKLHANCMKSHSVIVEFFMRNVGWLVGWMDK
jgi:hypothetical protein